MIKKLTQPIPVRLFDNDEKMVNEFAVTESRPVSWVIRTLVHEAINARLGITDVVKVPLVGTIGKRGSYRGHTIIETKLEG